MAAALQDHLHNLLQCIAGEDQVIGAQKAHSIVGDIGHYCLQDVSDRDIDFSCSVLFNKEQGVITFLKKTVTVDQFQASKAELLETLHRFMVRFPKKTLPYSVELKDVCLSLFAREKYAAVKKCVIPLLIEVIVQSSGSRTADDLQIQKLIDKFFMELTKSASKHTATIKQQIYHVLGVLAEVYPENMLMYSDKLVEVYIRALKAEMTAKSRKAETSIIAGCLQGFTGLLSQFSQSAQEGAKYAFDIYKYSVKACERDLNVSRYEMPRSALELLARHGAQFNEYMLDDYEAMYARLQFWVTHSNRDMQHVGTRAMDTFLKQVADTLVIRAKQGRKDNAVFKFFLLQFRQMMDSVSSSSKEIAMAIRGYGYFAAPCKLFLSEEDVGFMLSEMIQRSEQVFLSPGSDVGDRTMSLPSFLEALASIVRQLDDVTDAFVSALERLAVLLMESHVTLSNKVHYHCHLALLHVMFALVPKGAVFNRFLNTIVYQGVIRACSHPIVVETEEADKAAAMTESGQPQQLSYKDYLPMWTTLLKTTAIKELSALDIDLQQRSAMVEAIYDALIQAMLKIVERLDLTSNKNSELEEDMESLAGPSQQAADDEEAVTSDPVKGLQAAKPKDFIIFINLVDFSKDLLPPLQPEHFRRWVYHFGHTIILYSSRFPLVSGFYKLLSVCMRISSSIHYFKDIGDATAPALLKIKREDEAEEVDMEHQADRAQREAAFLLFNKFTCEVAVRLKQYKDDLLAACLTFLLSLPKEVVTAQIHNLVPPLKTVFVMGRSYLPLASAGLSALSQWSTTLPPHVLRPYYKDLLPCLDAYLKTTSGNESSNTVVIQSSAKNRSKRKIPVKVKREEKSSSYESELSKVQQKCVTLLGSLGGSVNNALVHTSAEELAKAAVAWDTSNHLKFDMPFIDVKPIIYFDVFLPRVMDLALTSGERQTKIAACELLHSLVLYMLGRSAIQPSARGAANKQPLTKLYAKVFPAILSLACDVEQVCRDLFEPLSMQLIHWFTGSKQYESDDTRTLLEAILDGIVSPTDTALRDFSARCIREYTKWAIKQTSKKELETSPTHIKSLLKRLYILARHPSAYKRLGAALAFNAMYTVFREEKSLVDQFVFELLVVFVESLALAHNDDKSLGTVTQCTESLNHLERIIKHYKTLLYEKSARRRIPRSWTGATLPNCLRWLLRQCGRPQTHCRHTCMELITKLALCLKDAKSAKDLFTSLHQTQGGAEYFIKRFEYGQYLASNNKHGLNRRPTIQSNKETFSVKMAQHWFDLVLTSLDCWVWVIGQGLYHPKNMVDSKGKGTVVFHVIQHVVTDIAHADIQGAALLCDPDATGNIYTPREREEYNRKKCTVLVRIIDFLCMLFGKHSDIAAQLCKGALWSEKMWDMILYMTLDPTALGFNMADVEVMEKLPEQAAQMLTVIKRFFPAKQKNDFQAHVSNRLESGPLCLQSAITDCLSNQSRDVIRVGHLVGGCELLYNTGNCKDTGNLAKLLLKTVFQSVCTKETGGRPTVASLSPTSKELAEKMLQLGLTLDIKTSDLVALLSDTTPLANAAATSSTQGAVFYTVFSPVISTHVVTMSTTIIPAVTRLAGKNPRLASDVLIGTLEHLARNRALRQKHGTGVLNSILGCWGDLSSWWVAGSNMHSQIITLLTKMLLVDAKLVTDVKKPHFAAVFEMYLDMLVDAKSTLPFKSRLLDLLPFFTSVSDAHSKQLKSKLDRLVSDNFPARSTEYTEGSPKYNDYITALTKILSAVELSGSLVLLEVLMSIICREEKHVIEDDIQDTIARFVKRLPFDRHKPALDVAFVVFAAESGYNAHQRRAAVERLLMPILRLVHTGALSEFFTCHITAIMAYIEAKMQKSGDIDSQLVGKLGSYQLMEVMFSRLRSDDVKSMTSQINNVYANLQAKTGKEMCTAFAKASLSAKAEDCRGEGRSSSLRRLYHCSAYNALVAMVCCTQTELKFYNSFLFKEDLAKGHMFWDNLVDPDLDYSFPIELEKLPSRRKKFVSIRNEVREEKGSGDGEDEAHSRSVHYLASQYLADSSLSGDVSQYDFAASASAVFSGSGMSGASFRSRRSRSNAQDLQEPTVTVRDDYVEMEMDALNQHPCMASFTALLQHMVRNNISPTPEKGGTVTMQAWMEHLHDKLQDSRTAKNIKIFICKLIVNTEEVFRPYARYWLSPIVQLIVSSQIPGEGINYFLTDLVVTILSWHTVAIPEDSTVDRAMATRLSEYLLKHLHHDTRAVLRNNLEVLKTLLEVWKPRLKEDIPTKIIYENFSEPDEKSKRNQTGLQMAAVYLANGISPFQAGKGVDKDKFYKVLAMNMLNYYKAGYSASAEVVGMVAKSIEPCKWKDEYLDNVSKMLLSIQATKPDQFITCVHKMHSHFPPVADKFVSRLLFLLPKMHGEVKAQCLDIIATRVDSIPNVFQEMKSKDILDILTHRDSQCQLRALRVVHAMLRHLKPPELQYLMPALAHNCRSNTDAECRAQVYESMMWIYDNFRDVDETDDVIHIMITTKDCLLAGLSDDDEKNRLSVQNFWRDETRLPVGTLDRLLALLEAMHSPSTESSYLSYATNLLLEITSRSPDFNREIFEHPLSECKFEEFKVASGWRQRHVAMTPMFVETQQQSQVVGLAAEGDEDVVDASLATGEIRATQDAAFSATQAGGSKGPYNWLTQSSMDTYADTDLTLSTQTTQDSSLLFTVGKAPKRQQKPVGPRFGKERMGVVKEEVESGSDKEILRLKRRFLKDQHHRQVYFMKKNIQINKRREQVKEEQRKRRENQVTMYRRYRAGDLPDIQIKYSYIIAPLQALAQRDSTVARLLFGSVFKAIFAELDTVRTEREARETTETIQRCFNQMLDKSTTYYPPFVGCVLDIAYGFPKRLKLEPSIVSTACTASLLQPLGAVLLEEMLLGSEAEERPSKRARGAASAPPPDTDNWLELARLYKSLEDYDVLRGIFSSKFGTQDITSKAIEAEMRGDYSEAEKLYTQGLSTEDWDGQPPSEIELDLWDDSRMQCCMELREWSKLEQFCGENIDPNTDTPDITKVWQDAYSQERFLPFLMTSKLKQLLQNQSDQQELLSFVDDALKIQDRKVLLEGKYAEALGLMYLHQEDYDRARHYTNQAIAAFIEEWGGIDPLMASSRTTKLYTIQKLVEMREFLSFVRHSDNLSSGEAGERLLQKWINRCPDPLLDPTTIWDDVITNRLVYLEHIEQRVENKQLEVAPYELRLQLAQAEAANAQGRFKLALGKMKEAKGVAQGDGGSYLEWLHTFTRIQHRRCQLTDIPPEDKIRALAGAYSSLEKQSGVSRKHLLASYGLRREQYILQGSTLSTILDVLRTHPRTDAATLDKLCTLMGGTDSSPGALSNKMVQRSYDLLKQGVSVAIEEEDARTGKSADSMNTAHLALANFCDKQMRQAEDSDESLTASMESFPAAMVTSLLRAMKNDCKEARQRFPRLLQLVEKYPGHVIDIFIKKVGEVPSWMFLGWCSQLTALLDKSESPAIQDLLITLAHDYPQALVYPFKMSNDGYKFDSNAMGKKSAAVRDKLHGLLESNVLIERFIASLEQFGQPNSLFRDWYEDGELRGLIDKKRNAAENKRLLTLYQEMYRDLLDHKNQVDEEEDSLYSTQSLAASVCMCEYRKKFAQRFNKELDKEFGKGGEKLLKMTLREFSQKAVALGNNMKNVVDSSDRRTGLPPPNTLAEYSKWLAGFQGSTYEQEIEVPGQYTGQNKPLPEYHTKIASFRETVKVLTSIQKPKRITICGNDANEFQFLVKGGEDLRLDQRIEQMFGLMNEIFAADPMCRQRKLTLTTYQVVPMTPRVGMIEWMSDTTTLKEFIKSACTEQEMQIFNSGPMKEHTNFIGLNNKDRVPVSYHKCFQTKSRTETTNNMKKKENMLPWNLLRRAYQSMSASPEAFFTLKNHFATSHAQVSVCQYVLGVGDRHLSNFMVDLLTGKMVGIDFGHSFGSATQFLPIPELLPLRLTHQLRGLLQPLREKGLLEGTMIHCLRALRNNADLLLNTMDVFIKEPSLDWKKNAEKQRARMNNSPEDEGDASSDQWYPKQKVDYARKKLQGYNPAYITKDELNLNTTLKKDVRACYEKVVLGTRDTDVRARLPEKGLSVEQQVAALLNQSTDANILGRTWQGWEPWV